MNNALINAAIQGDREALEQLLNKFRDHAFSIALKFVKDSTAAEDVVQEAFIKIFFDINKFRNEAAFSTWLFKIVYVESIRYLRKTNQLRNIYESLERTDNYEEETQNENSEFVIEDRVNETMEVL